MSRPEGDPYLERLRSQLDETTRDSQRWNEQASRARVAYEHGLSGEDVDLLGAGTDEQLQARARHIVALRGGPGTQPSTDPIDERWEHYKQYFTRGDQS